MDRFIGQPKFAKFEHQESNQRIRQESKLPVSGSPAQRHDRAPLLHLPCDYSMLTNRSPICMELHIPYTVRIATVCNILHKQLRTQYPTCFAYFAYLYGYSHLVLCCCRELPEHPGRLANEGRELVSCCLDASI